MKNGEINIEGDYTRDVILPIVSECQMYQGISNKDFVKIRVNSDCTYNAQKYYCYNINYSSRLITAITGRY